jgi:hypothetical protein
MTQLFCNIPALDVAIAYRFSDPVAADEIVRWVSDRVSGIRLPPYSFAEKPDFEVVAAVELEASIDEQEITVQFGGGIPSHRYSVRLPAFHWDFWKVSIAALSKGLLSRGVVIFHAACVEAGAAIYLLPGVSGAGKSSLSFFARSAGAPVYSSELAFVEGDRLIAGNSLMSIDPDALRVMGIPASADIELIEGKATLPTSALKGRSQPLRLMFPRISPSSSYLERAISARRSRMLLFENAVGQLGVSQLIDEQRSPVQSLPTHPEVDTIMQAVDRLGSECLICEGQPSQVWARLKSG